MAPSSSTLTSNPSPSAVTDEAESPDAFDETSSGLSVLNGATGSPSASKRLPIAPSLKQYLTATGLRTFLFQTTRLPSGWIMPCAGTNSIDSSQISSPATDEPLHSSPPSAFLNLTIALDLSYSTEDISACLYLKPVLPYVSPRAHMASLCPTSFLYFG